MRVARQAAAAQPVRHAIPNQMYSQDCIDDAGEAL
jgi:hypothetical protein